MPAPKRRVELHSGHARHVEAPAGGARSMVTMKPVKGGTRRCEWCQARRAVWRRAGKLRCERCARLENKVDAGEVVLRRKGRANGATAKASILAGQSARVELDNLRPRGGRNPPAKSSQVAVCEECFLELPVTGVCPTCAL